MFESLGSVKAGRRYLYGTANDFCVLATATTFVGNDNFNISKTWWLCLSCFWLKKRCSFYCCCRERKKSCSSNWGVSHPWVLCVCVFENIIAELERQRSSQVPKKGRRAENEQQEEGEAKARRKKASKKVIVYFTPSPLFHQRSEGH